MDYCSKRRSSIYNINSCFSNNSKWLRCSSIIRSHRPSRRHTTRKSFHHRRQAVVTMEALAATEAQLAIIFPQKCRPMLRFILLPRRLRQLLARLQVVSVIVTGSFPSMTSTDPVETFWVLHTQRLLHSERLIMTYHDHVPLCRRLLFIHRRPLHRLPGSIRPGLAQWNRQDTWKHQKQTLLIKTKVLNSLGIFVLKNH